MCSFILILEESSSKLKGGVEEVELLGCSIVCICICICICICMSMISTCSTREKKKDPFLSESCQKLCIMTISHCVKGFPPSTTGAGRWKRELIEGVIFL